MIPVPTSCIQCGRNLIESGEQYVIEKVFRRFGNDQSSIEPIIELAMCLDCRDNEGQSMSTESADSIRQYFEQNVDFGRRLVDLTLAEQSYIEDCHVCCRPIVVSCTTDAGQLEAIFVCTENE